MVDVRASPAGTASSEHPGRRLAVGSVAVLVIVWLWTLVQRVPIGDRWVAVNVWNKPIPTDLQQLATFFGDAGTTSVAFVTIAISALVVWRNLGRREALFVVLSAFAVVVAAVLKDLHGPTELNRELSGSGSGFPSGHAAYVASLFGAFVVLGRRSGRTDVVLVSSFVIVGMAPARMLSAAHVPSELIAGYATGFAWLGVVLLAEARMPGR